MIDSIQTVFLPELESAPGSVAQVRECGARLMTLAKGRGIATFLVGHVTKEGSLAGPRVLEHLVDTVLYFEGEHHHAYRVLRAVKNRFGSTNEIGVFEMAEGGLVEVPNPSGFFLAERPADAPGSVIVSALEGTRPLLLELQALVSRASFGTPRRTVLGADYNRVCLLLAVLEKRAGLPIGNQDVFVNVAGGGRVAEPAADLGVVIAAASSYLERPVRGDVLVLGEVGLTGEVRAVSGVEPRLRAAAQLGFKSAIVPRSNAEGSLPMPVTPVATVERRARSAARLTPLRLARLVAVVGGALAGAALALSFGGSPVVGGVVGALVGALAIGIEAGLGGVPMQTLAVDDAGRRRRPADSASRSAPWSRRWPAAPGPRCGRVSRCSAPGSAAWWPHGAPPSCRRFDAGRRRARRACSTPRSSSTGASPTSSTPASWAVACWCRAFVVRELQTADRRQRPCPPQSRAPRLRRAGAAAPKRVGAGRDWTTATCRAGGEVDAKLVALARARGARLLTNDTALGRVAALAGVTVGSLNDLAGALRPAALPGEGHAGAGDARGQGGRAGRGLSRRRHDGGGRGRQASPRAIARRRRDQRAADLGRAHDLHAPASEDPGGGRDA